MASGPKTLDMPTQSRDRLAIAPASKRPRAMLLGGGGFARIYGPEGSSLAEPIPEDEEGILYADCDPSLQAIARSAADPVGHYSRPDVTQLLFNRSQRTPIVASDAVEPAVVAVDEPDPAPAGEA